jgi:hypothetical protein
MLSFGEYLEGDSNRYYTGEHILFYTAIPGIKLLHLVDMNIWYNSPTYKHIRKYNYGENEIKINADKSCTVIYISVYSWKTMPSEDIMSLLPGRINIVFHLQETYRPHFQRKFASIFRKPAKLQAVATHGT